MKKLCDKAQESTLILETDYECHPHTKKLGIGRERARECVRARTRASAPENAGERAAGRDI